jgi:hypothetical protein
MRSAVHLAIVVAALGSSCHRADSILLVEVAGDLRLQPAQFYVVVEVTKRPPPKPFSIPPVPATISLPASFTIELDRSLTGPVVVSVDAYDANMTFLGSGQTRQDHIKVGDDTIIVVNLMTANGVDLDGGPPTPDAGDPDAGDPDAGVVDAADPDATPTDAEDQ